MAASTVWLIVGYIGLFTFGAFFAVNIIFTPAEIFETAATFWGIR